MSNDLEALQVPHAPLGALLGSQALTLHLLQLGYPKQSLDSMSRCGLPTGQFLKHCSCGIELIESRHKCNLRTCPQCSLKRKARLRHKFFPFMSKLARDRKYFFYFLTISPSNYPNLKEGLIDIRKKFNKFLRHNYIKDRLKAGIYVIEAKKSLDSWNIHIHCIVYGRFLDNRIRGKCLDCNQNLLKFDYISKKHYCANRFCNSLNVEIKKDSKLVQLWKKSNHQEVNMHISRQGSVIYTLNYMLKYISSNKDDFNDAYDMADYIVSTRKHKLISTFGLFYKVKIEKQKHVCCFCGCEIDFINDKRVIHVYLDSIRSVKPPNLNDFYSK